jgi:trigger factor
VTARLGELRNQVRINGFRPGKVPVDHLRRMYGRSVMAEVIEAAVQEGNAKIVSDNGLRLAGQPKVTFPTAEAEVKEVVAGKADLSYSVAVEVLPRIELADFKGIKIEKQVAEVADQEVDEAINALAEQNRPYDDAGADAKAETGDRVIVSFEGTIDGQPFEGGTGEDITVGIGSKTFLPGFEEQLVGIAPGETRTVKADFPPNYTNAALAGKAAEFSVTANRIERPGPFTVDEEFAKSLGMESLTKLKEAVRERIAREHAAVTRRRMKRMLLDELDKRHQFELPQTMVDDEFNNVWKTIVEDLQAQGRSFTDEGTTEEAAQADYRKIAERRVRLGLVLAEIGDRGGIKVSDEDVNRALVERVRQFPGQEQRVWDFYRKNPDALANVRAPIFEEKVVDYLVELATVTEKQVSREELFKEDDGEEGTAAGAASA